MGLVRNRDGNRFTHRTVIPIPFRRKLNWNEGARIGFLFVQFGALHDLLVRFVL